MKKDDNNKRSYIFTRETFGMTVLLFSALMLLIIATSDTIFSGLGKAVCTFMYGTFGYGSYLVVAALAVLGVWLAFDKKPKVRLRMSAMIGLTITMLFMLFHAVTSRDFTMSSFGAYLSQCYSEAEAGYAGYTFGGAVSGLLVYPIANGTTFVGAYIIFSVLSALCIYLTTLVVRAEIMSRGGKVKTVKLSQKVNNNLSQVNDPNVVNDNMYSVSTGNEIVNNFQTAQPEPAYFPPQQQDYFPQQEFVDMPPQDFYALPQDIIQPQQQDKGYVSLFDQIAYQRSSSEDDRFSSENLGRKIIFEKGEFAAESYRRNMIFDEDSYFNRPVQHPEPVSSSLSSSSASSSSSGSVSSAPSTVNSSSSSPLLSSSAAYQQSRPQAQSQQQAQVSSVAPQPQTTKLGTYPQSYSDSYTKEVEEREQEASSMPSYIYGDKPADSLDDFFSSNDSDDFSGYDEPTSFVDDSIYEDFNNSEDSSEQLLRQDIRDIVRELPIDNSYESSEDVRRLDSDRSFEQPSRLSVEDDLGDFARQDFNAGERNNTIDEENARTVDNNDIGIGFGRQLNHNSRTDRLGENIDLSPTDVRSSSTLHDKEEDNIFSVRADQHSSRRDADMALSRETERPLEEHVEVSNTSAIPSRNEPSGRESIFDVDTDDEYLMQDEPDLGVRGLRDSTPHDDERSSKRSEVPVVPERKVVNVPDLIEISRTDTSRQESTPKREVEPPAPPKPKHVWKKYVRPSLDLLADYPENNSASVSEIEENKKLIVETLENFHIAAHISDVIVGPAITRYDVIIEDRTNIKNAMRYREAIAMALMKENVTAYLNYSKGAISIEVPNNNRTVVGLKSILTSSEFINCKNNTLTFALGKNVEGKPNCPDITKMPHLLVAGTTGSGKSICLSSLIISLLFKYGPDELRFILVDPKQSEFISYENLPHLIVNEIISDVDKAIKALNWAIKEMERRYALFKEMTLAGTLVKNINEYNSHLSEDEEKLPKIVIILDEFGDLMLQNKKDIESRIIRLVQKSRACGIHLILATQRPSVDCITGLIKSNLPTRIGFKVNSFDDSRTIFDVGGAEKLLGAGDMYYRSAQKPDLTRIQGCFIDSPEVQAVTDFVKKNNESYFDQSISDFINTVEEPDSGDGGSDDGNGDGEVKIDDKFIQALKFCVTSNQASVSMLQRRFPIGYVKACKIIDWMENMNYITQSEGSKPRKVLLSLDEFTRIYGDVDD